jgi:hypothetical protein
MNTKTLLIIFAVLLLLLTLLSAFGGSLRVAPEMFTQNHPFEKFFDPSTMVIPEEGAITANPIFQTQSSSEMGQAALSPIMGQPTLPPIMESAPSIIATGETLIEPFEDNMNIAPF